jgi:hypothetical protein
VRQPPHEEITGSPAEEPKDNPINPNTHESIPPARTRAITQTLPVLIPAFVSISPICRNPADRELAPTKPVSTSDVMRMPTSYSVIFATVLVMPLPVLVLDFYFRNPGIKGFEYTTTTKNSSGTRLFPAKRRRRSAGLAAATASPTRFGAGSKWFPLLEEHRGTPPDEHAFEAGKTINCFIVFRPVLTSIVPPSFFPRHAAKSYNGIRPSAVKFLQIS